MVMLLGAVQLTMFSVLFISDVGELLKATLLSEVGYTLQNLSLIAYQKTSFLEMLWDITPRLNVHQPFTLETLMFLGIMVVIGTGGYIRECGKQLADDVAAIRKKARDELWLRSMLPQDQAATGYQPASQRHGPGAADAAWRSQKLVGASGGPYSGRAVDYLHRRVAHQSVRIDLRINLPE